MTLAHPQSADSLGYRVQAWLRNTGFSNISASIAPGRVSTTLTNDQYSTPALGWGFNAALRGSSAWLDWEVGGDARFTQGESKEHFQLVSGAFTLGRVSGGRTFVGGLYAEGASRFDGLLVTAGLRADQWASTGGHLIQTTLATGVVTVNQHTPSKSGIVPTARFGVRRQELDGRLLSALGRLWRFPRADPERALSPVPPRQQHHRSQSRPDAGETLRRRNRLRPDQDAFGWDVTGFYNQLHGAITNVTVGHGLLVVPGLGTVPAGRPC